ncbi:hypothetical protein GA0115256_11745, partial [Streptomyces sp. DconLS]
ASGRAPTGGAGIGRARALRRARVTGPGRVPAMVRAPGATIATTHAAGAVLGPA